MLLTIAIILGLLWFFGFIVIHVGGGLIHLILLIALVVLIYDLIVGRRRV